MVSNNALFYAKIFCDWLDQYRNQDQASEEVLFEFLSDHHLRPLLHSENIEDIVRLIEIMITGTITHEVIREQQNSLKVDDVLEVLNRKALILKDEKSEEKDYSKLIEEIAFSERVSGFESKISEGDMGRMLVYEATSMIRDMLAENFKAYDRIIVESLERIVAEEQSKYEVNKPKCITEDEFYYAYYNPSDRNIQKKILSHIVSCGWCFNRLIDFWVGFRGIHLMSDEDIEEIEIPSETEEAFERARKKFLGSIKNQEISKEE